MRSIAHSVPIGDVVEKIENWDPANSSEEKPFLYIDISSVDRETKTVLPAPVIFPKDAPSRARQLVKAQDILVSTVRPNLNAVAQIQDQLDGATASTGFCVLRPKMHMVDSRYLYFWVRTTEFIEEMVKRATGASYPAVSDSIIKSSIIPLPSLDEQRRIAAILDKADTIRRKRQESMRLTEEFLRSTFLEMFGDPVSNPRGWESCELNKVCLNITDGTHDTPTRVSSGVPFLTSKNIRPFEIDLTDLDFVTIETHKEIIKRCNPKFGDILYTNIGVNVGNAVANRLEFEFSLKNVALIQPDSKKLEFTFLESLLNYEQFKQSVLSASSIGGAQKFIALKVLRNIQIILPPRQLQHDFSSIVASTLKIKNTQQTSLEYTFNQFDSLTNCAFSGEL